MASEAFRLGAEAFYSNEEPINPYDYGSEDYDEWDAGYDSAVEEYNRSGDDRYGTDIWYLDPAFDDMYED